MTARRKYKSTGPLADSGTAKTKRDPLCPSALCRCGHKRKLHSQSPSYPPSQLLCGACDCQRFVLAKPKKPAARKAQALARFDSTEPLASSMLAMAKLPTKADWSLEGPSPEQVQTIRKIDGSRDSGLLRDSYWEEQTCRFSGNGHEGCFVAPVNRHGGPCAPCWARARRRMSDQKAEIAKLKGGLM